MYSNKFSPLDKVYIATSACLLLGVVIEVRTFITTRGSETRYIVEHFDAVCGATSMVCSENQLSDTYGFSPTLYHWLDGVGKDAAEHADKIIAERTPTNQPTIEEIAAALTAV